MQAQAGQRILIRGKTVEAPDRHGVVLDARGADGGPPFLVRFDDGHETLVYPGADMVIEVVKHDS